MLFRGAAVAAVVLLGPVSAFADTPEDKLQILKEMQKQVNRYAYFTIFDNVEVAFEDDGVVILSGSVTMPFKKTEIVKRVARVEGVTHVEDAIDVLPVSRYDNQLRYRVARAIYGHSAFQHYSRLRPPVHIVVDRGHVTLKGVVNSELDKTLVRSLAGQFDAFSVTNELQTIDEAEAELELLD